MLRDDRVGDGKSEPLPALVGAGSEGAVENVGQVFFCNAASRIGNRNVGMVVIGGQGEADIAFAMTVQGREVKSRLPSRRRG